MKRERIKREWRDIMPVVTASVALARGLAPAWEHVISERLYNDSKLLGRIRSNVVSILVRADPRWEGVPPEEATELLEAYGVRRKPGLIRCAGIGIVHIGTRSYDLCDFQPVAHLPEGWAVARAISCACCLFPVRARLVSSVPRLISFVRRTLSYHNLHF